MNTPDMLRGFCLTKWSTYERKNENPATETV